MKLITRNTDYAIRALLYLAQDKEKVVSVERLVEKLDLPYPFLRRILQILHKNNILKAYKGYRGGFKLIVSPDKIFLKKLIEIFQGELRLNKCSFCSNFKRCLLKKRLDKIQNYVVSQLNSISLSSLLRKTLNRTRKGKNSFN